MSSCTPSTPGGGRNRRTHPLLEGNETWAPRSRDQEQNAITCVLYRAVVVTVTPGREGVEVIFAAQHSCSAALNGPNHADFGARTIIYRAYL